MGYNFLKIIGFTLIVVVFNRCAQVGTLTGGKRDSTPPKLLLALPSLNSTNFNSDIITLKFDEFVQLKDLNNQLVISPKLKTRPEIEADGKKIMITLNKEDLLPNTTYRFYFGKAICDMHEGNPLSNFSYIFSTGNSIDSLKVSGEVVSAFQKQKEKDVVVGLYVNKNLEDSFAYKNTPDYICITDNQGRFQITNLPEAEFKVVCFSDKNKDYMYNGADYETVGFLNETLFLKGDSAFKLELFKEIPSRTYIKKVVMNENGRGMIIFNQLTHSRIHVYDEKRDDDIFQLNRDSDTSEFFYRHFKDTLWLKVNYGSRQTDTLKLKIPVIRTRNKGTIKISGNIFRNSLNYFERPSVVFNQWIDTSVIEAKRIRLVSKTDTSVNKTTVGISWEEPNKLLINTVLKPKVAYALKIDTGAFRSYNGLTNDSVKVPFQVLKKTDLGALTLKITFNTKQAYLVQLINTTNTIVKQERVAFSLSASNTASLSFTDVPEDSYRVKIIYDKNDDGIWNTGNYLKLIQPEKTYIFEKVIKILPDWEVEEEFVLKE